MPDSDNRRSFGRYEVLRSLGRGAVGEVFLARDPALGRQVALKTLSGLEALPPDERTEARARFLREARAAAGLSHPHIVTIHDVGEADGVPFLAMEHLQGTTLDRYVKPGHLLPAVKVLELGVQAALALDEAHRRGVIHRDVKPANLVLLEDGGVKVVDFGLARGPEANLTAAETLLGTPNYMSPEQIAGQRLDGRSDLFSLAVTLFELLTGQRPFGGDSVSSVLYRIVNDPPLALTRVRQDLPPSLEALLDQALAKSPDERPRSCGVFAGELGQALAELGGVPAGLRLPAPADLTAPAPTGPTEAAGARPRRPWALLALAVAALAVLAVAVWATPLSTVLGLRAAERTILVETDPAGLDVKVSGEGPAHFVQPGRLAAPAKLAAPLTLEAQDACRAGTVTLPPGPAPERVRVATTPRSVDIPLTSAPGGAAVVLDGKSLPGRTPLELTLSACREHIVELRAADHAAARVTLPADGPLAAWRASLDNVALQAAPQPEAPRVGQVVVPPPPGYSAEILSDDGRRLGAAGKPITLTPGTHELLAVNREVLLRKRVTAKVTAGRTSRVDAAWPRLGALTVWTTPPGGKVFAKTDAAAEPVEIGASPLNRAAVVAGEYELTIEHPLTGKRVTRTVVVRADTDNPPVRVGQEDWH